MEMESINLFSSRDHASRADVVIGEERRKAEADDGSDSRRIE